ncbi:MAG: hypothetical protein J0I12_20190 [Candidatus Eremiobacteraeota bacterium]|nr:hypothetical protein [Candidatus Eremiobacteraeota bacterium]
MLRNMFLLFTAVDVLAISTVLDQGKPELHQLAIMWLVVYSSVAAWALGMRAWKECQGSCPGPQALLRILTCSSLYLGGCAAALQFGGKNPQEWLGIYLFLVVYLIRLMPAAAATVVVSPFLWISRPRVATLPLVLICQLGCWYGGWTFLGGESGWQEAFLYIGMWAPGWGYALMIGGVILKPLLPREKPAG